MASNTFVLNLLAFLKLFGYQRTESVKAVMFGLVRINVKHVK